MIKVINKMLMFLKVVLLIVAFALTLYILLYMYYNLHKKPWGEDFVEFISVLVPYAVLLILFVINIVIRQKNINENTFYNVTCFVVLFAIIFISYRALADQNMVLWHKTDYHINFDYYADQIFQIKAMLYGLIAINIFAMIENKLGKKKELVLND